MDLVPCQESLPLEWSQRAALRAPSASHSRDCAKRWVSAACAASNWRVSARRRTNSSPSPTPMTRSIGTAATSPMASSTSVSACDSATLASRSSRAVMALQGRADGEALHTSRTGRIDLNPGERSRRGARPTAPLFVSGRLGESLDTPYSNVCTNSGTRVRQCQAFSTGSCARRRPVRLSGADPARTLNPPARMPRGDRSPHPGSGASPTCIPTASPGTADGSGIPKECVPDQGPRP